MSSKVDKFLIKHDLQIIVFIISLILIIVLGVVKVDVGSKIQMIYESPREVRVLEKVKDNSRYYLIITNNDKRELMQISFEGWAVVLQNQDIYLISKPQLYESSWLTSVEAKTQWFQDYIEAIEMTQKISNKNAKLKSTESIVVKVMIAIAFLNLLGLGYKLIKKE